MRNAFRNSATRDGPRAATGASGNAHLAWAVAMYLEEPDVEALASEALTDGPNDKKIDLIYLDRDGRRIVFAQGYMGTTKKDSAPANKAARYHMTLGPCRARQRF